jgi:hypothetical protein
MEGKMNKKTFVGLKGGFSILLYALRPSLFAISPLLFALCLIVPNTTFAADKLVVKDAGGVNTTFVVTDDGKVGAGTSNPQVSLHIVDSASNPLRGILSAIHSNNIVPPVFFLRKSRGTETSPTGVIQGDWVSSISSQGYDGNTYQASAAQTVSVDGPVSSGVVPMSIGLMTGTSTANKIERLKITSSGKMIVNDLKGTYTGGSAYVCVNNNGQLFTSETACP